jgi:hypothetical protein
MKSWRTTLFGAVGASVLTANTLLTTGTVDLRTVIISGFLAGIGFLAKDKNVTGIK